MYRQKQWLGGWVVLLLLWLVAACSGSVSSEVWEEEFEDAEAWRLSSDAAASVAVEEDALHIRVHQPGQVAWAASARTFEDFHLRVEASQVDGPDNNEYGVLVRMKDDDEFYAFSISGDGYVRAASYAEGAWSLLGADWTPSDAVVQGAATNVLTVEAHGPEFTFQVNDVTVLTVEDDTLQRGEIGLYAGAFDTPNVHVAFDNLSVTPIH
jgi:hypothetical protein